MMIYVNLIYYLIAETKVSEGHVLLMLSNDHSIMPLKPFVIGLLPKVRFWVFQQLFGGSGSGPEVLLKVFNGK